MNDKETIKELANMLQRWVDISSHISLASGVCCCGDEMDNHSSAMLCGHSPVDSGDYYAMRLINHTLELFAKMDNFKSGK